MAILDPMIALSNVDFPTLERPIMTTKPDLGIGEWGKGGGRGSEGLQIPRYSLLFPRY